MTDALHPATPREAAAEIVLALVSTLSGVGQAVLAGPRQTQAAACSRRAAAALLQTDLGLSARRTGELLGRRATTVRSLSRTAAHDRRAGELMAGVRAALRILGRETLRWMTGHRARSPRWRRGAVPPGSRSPPSPAAQAWPVKP